MLLSNYGSSSQCLGAMGSYRCVRPVKDEGVVWPTLAWGTISLISTHRLRTMVHWLRRFLRSWSWNDPNKLSKFKGHDARLLNWPRRTLLLWATVWPLWAIFTFVPLKRPLIGHPRTRSFHCRFRILGVKFLLVFLSNCGSNARGFRATIPEPFDYYRHTCTNG